jgi:hypothetical protein
MPTFAVNTPITTREPTVTVDAGLPVGRHRFRLEVIDTAGLRSTRPDEAVVEIQRVVVDPGPVITGPIVTGPIVTGPIVATPIPSPGPIVLTPVPQPGPIVLTPVPGPIRPPIVRDAPPDTAPPDAAPPRRRGRRKKEKP